MKTISPKIFHSQIKKICGAVKLVHAYGLIFPAEIDNLINLGHADLHFMGFSPTRTLAEFKKLKDLKYIWTRDTNLIGEILESFENFQSVEHIDLAYNTLK